MAIDPGKQRISLSFTKTVVADFRAITREMGFTQSIMSVVCEEALKKTTELFQRARDKGGIGIVDLFNMIGEEMESIEDYERMTKERGKNEVKNCKGKRSATMRKAQK